MFMVNEALVRAGLAAVATFPPDVKYVERFTDAQDAAQAEGLGIWSAPAEEPEPEPAPEPEPDPEPAQARDCDSSYPDVCIPSPPPDLDCGEISFRRFRVVGSVEQPPPLGALTRGGDADHAPGLGPVQIR